MIPSNLYSEYETYLLLERSMSTNTVESYLRSVRKLDTFLNIKSIIHTTHKDILEFLNHINIEDSISDASQALVISSLRAFFKFIINTGLVQQNPLEFVEINKTGKKLPNILEIHEIESILNSIDHSTSYGMRNRAILEVLYGMGLRVSELINITLNNIIFDEMLIYIIGKGKKYRVVPIGNMALKYLNIYLDEVRPSFLNEPSTDGFITKTSSTRKNEKQSSKILSSIFTEKRGNNYLFLNKYGNKISRIAIFKMVKKAVKDAGIAKEVSPHTFRHSFATHMIEAGGDLRAIQELLGHSSINTTEIYTHLDKSYLKQTITDFHPRNK